MNLIICLDDRNGIQFNGRRQSRDRLLCNRILQITDGAELWMSPYSAEMFPADRVRVSPDYLDKAGPGAYCFAETGDFLTCEEAIEQVIVYRWNRLYPADVKLDPGFLQGRRLLSAVEFPGHSHENITEERYE